MFLKTLVIGITFLRTSFFLMTGRKYVQFIPLSEIRYKQKDTDENRERARRESRKMTEELGPWRANLSF